MKREARQLERKSNASKLNIDAEIHGLKLDEYNHCLNEKREPTITMQYSTVLRIRECCSV